MAKKKPEQEQEIQDAEVVVWEPDKTHRVQVRLDDAGPKKADGRRGQIVLQDNAAPDSVARWLSSPKCLKAEKGSGGKRQAYIWVDDVLLSNVSEDIPDADSPETALATTSPQAAETEAARQYLAHLLAEIRIAEKDLSDTRERVRKEIAAEVTFRDKEISTCNAQIEEARGRLATELKREADELEALAARRVAYGEERAQATLSLAKDVELTATTRALLSKKMLSEEKSWMQAAWEGLSTPQGKMIAAGIASKLGADKDTIESLLSVATAGNNPPEG